MNNIGVIRSSDNGDTWHYIGLDTLEINGLAFNNEYIFASDNKGKIFRRKLKEFICFIFRTYQWKQQSQLSLKDNRK